MKVYMVAMMDLTNVAGTGCSFADSMRSSTSRGRLLRFVACSLGDCLEELGGTRC
jgi:hypothetical protein